MSTHLRASLFETAHGNVRRCSCCSMLEVRFGNALLAVTPDDLPHVLDQLDAAESHTRPHTRPRLDEAAADDGDASEGGGGGEVTLLLGDSGSGWVFNRSEAIELHRLVAGAQLLLGLAA